MTRELLIINSDASILVFFVHLVLFFFFNMQHVQNILKKNNDFVYIILWPGPTRCIPVAGNDVHKVHPNIQKDGTVL